MAALPSSLDYRITFDLPNEEFILTDLTDYTGVTGTLTAIFSVTDPTGTLYQSTIALPATIPNIAIPTLVSGAVIPGLYTFNLNIADSVSATDIDLDKTYTYSYETPTVDVNMTVDCIYPLLTSTDSTDYTISGITPTTLTRSHVLQYPPATSQADYTVTTAILQTGTVYTLVGQPLQHSATVTTTLEYAMTSRITILDEAIGTGYIDVSCDNSLCDVYCALKCKWQDYENQKCKNKTLADKAMSDFIEMTAYARMIESAMKCGKGDDITAYVAAINALGGCDGCGCDDGDPILVTGLGATVGGGSVYNVVSGGSPIVITSATVGDTTTFTVTIDSAVVAKITSLRNSIVEAGTNISVTPTTAIDGTVTYTVNSLASAPDSLSFVITSDNSTLNAIPVLTISDVETTGTIFDPVPSISWLAYQPYFPDTYTTSPSVPQFTSGIVSLLLQDLFTVTYTAIPKIHIQKLKVYRKFENAPTWAQDNIYKNIDDYISFEAYYDDMELKISPVYATDYFTARTGDNFIRTTNTLPGSFDAFDHRNFYFQIAVTITI
jgi:hypothetical protein